MQGTAVLNVMEAKKHRTTRNAFKLTGSKLPLLKGDRSNDSNSENAVPRAVMFQAARACLNVLMSKSEQKLRILRELHGPDSPKARLSLNDQFLSCSITIVTTKTIRQYLAFLKLIDGEIGIRYHQLHCIEDLNDLDDDGHPLALLHEQFYRYRRLLPRITFYGVPYTITH